MTRRLLKQRGIINVAAQLPCTAIVNEIDTPMQNILLARRILIHLNLY